MFTVCSFPNNFLLLLVIIIQCIVKIGFVTENFIPNYQSLFFKLTELAQLEFRETWIVLYTNNLTPFIYLTFSKIGGSGHQI